MNAIQLRPGNLVHVLTHPSSKVRTDKVYKIAEISDHKVIVVSLNDERVMYKPSYNDIVPVTLTDHWRQLLGLIYKPVKGWVWDNNHIDWSLSKFEEWRKEEYRYVHEIQNLFYFIHDTELELKELPARTFSTSLKLEEKPSGRLTLADALT